jgi:dihydroxyacetone kinase-like predicted kinase
MHEGKSTPATVNARVSTVAIVAGDGMAEVFQSVGCTRLVSGGPTMNPSAQEILEAVSACPAEDVVVLPNDKNIIMAAKQAAEASQKRVKVVESRSMPQGLAALLAANADDTVEETMEAMQEALGSVRTIEVTRAVRTTSIGGVKVNEGQAIAVVDDELTHAVDSTEDAVVEAIEGVVSSSTSLITLYRGAEAAPDAADRLVATLGERFPGHEVELHYGGQPHYDYIVSVE